MKTDSTKELRPIDPREEFSDWMNFRLMIERPWSRAFLAWLVGALLLGCSREAPHYVLGRAASDRADTPDVVLLQTDDNAVSDWYLEPEQAAPWTLAPGCNGAIIGASELKRSSWFGPGHGPAIALTAAHCLDACQTIDFEQTTCSDLTHQKVRVMTDRQYLDHVWAHTECSVVGTWPDLDLAELRCDDIETRSEYRFAKTLGTGERLTVKNLRAGRERATRLLAVQGRIVEVEGYFREVSQAPARFRAQTESGSAIVNDRNELVAIAVRMTTRGTTLGIRP